ncbi:MAG: hypothetical protein IJ543_06575 [Bacteroidales bacterium]|nr:hypothetical protein [Bacteroidales bacterium]
MFRYRFLLILLFVFSGSFINLKGQDCDCYATTRAQGVKLMQQKKYAKAIAVFNAAEDCPDKPAGNDLAQKRAECEKAIKAAEDTKRQAAEDTKRQAEEDEYLRRKVEEIQQREDEYWRRKVEEIQQRKKEESADKGYMDIEYVHFGNESKNRDVLTWYGGTLYDEEMRYLVPKIGYTGLANESKAVTLHWKIFRPDGTMFRNDQSPAGYTSSYTYTILPGSGNTVTLLGWGSETGGLYKPGLYRFELYCNGHLLRTEYADIKAKNTTTTNSTSKTATIKEVTVDHNVYQDGNKGMKIHVKFDIQNCKDDACRAIAYFYYANGTAIKDTNGLYKDASGNVSAGVDFKPGYDDTVYSDLIIFMPYSEIHSTTRTGTVEMYFDTKLYDFTSKEFIGNNYKVTFNMTY